METIQRETLKLPPSMVYGDGSSVQQNSVIRGSLSGHYFYNMPVTQLTGHFHSGCLSWLAYCVWFLELKRMILLEQHED